jgi:hypothetical protein
VSVSDNVPSSQPGTSSQSYVLRNSVAAREAFDRRTAAADAAYLLPHLETGMRVVDFGCGTGSITLGLAATVTQLEPADARRASWPAVMRLLRAEIAELLVAGAREVQLDLPQIAMGLADGGWETNEAVDIIGELVADLPAGIRKSTHLCYGDFGARTWTATAHCDRLLAAYLGEAGMAVFGGGL